MNIICLLGIIILCGLLGLADDANLDARNRRKQR